MAVGLAVAGLAVLAGRAAPALRSRIPTVPAGDLVVVVEALAAGAAAAGRALAPVTARLREAGSAVVGLTAGVVARAGPHLDAAEWWLRRWRTVGLLFLLLGAALAVTLVGGR